MFKTVTSVAVDVHKIIKEIHECTGVSEDNIEYELGFSHAWFHIKENAENYGAKKLDSLLTKINDNENVFKCILISYEYPTIEIDFKYRILK